MCRRNNCHVRNFHMFGAILEQRSMFAWWNYVKGIGWVRFGEAGPPLSCMTLVIFMSSAFKTISSSKFCKPKPIQPGKIHFKKVPRKILKSPKQWWNLKTNKKVNFLRKNHTKIREHSETRRNWECKSCIST